MWHKFSGVRVGVDPLSVTLQWFVWLHQFVPNEDESHYVLDWFKKKIIKKNSTFYFYFPSLPLKACSKPRENTYKVTANLITAISRLAVPESEGECQEFGRRQEGRKATAEGTAPGTLQSAPAHPPPCNAPTQSPRSLPSPVESFLRKEERGKELKKWRNFSLWNCPPRSAWNRFKKARKKHKQKIASPESIKHAEF